MMWGDDRYLPSIGSRALFLAVVYTGVVVFVLAATSLANAL
jgi:hypothetical protein